RAPVPPRPLEEPEAARVPMHPEARPDRGDDALGVPDRAGDLRGLFGREAEAGGAAAGELRGAEALEALHRAVGVAGARREVREDLALALGGVAHHAGREAL